MPREINDNQIRITLENGYHGLFEVMYVFYVEAYDKEYCLLSEKQDGVFTDLIILREKQDKDEETFILKSIEDPEEYEVVNTIAEDILLGQ